MCRQRPMDTGGWLKASPCVAAKHPGQRQGLVPLCQGMLCRVGGTASPRGRSAGTGGGVAVGTVPPTAQRPSLLLGMLHV